MFEYDATGVTEKDIEGPTFDPVPEGDYELGIIDTEEKVSQNMNQMVVAKLEIQHKDYLGKLVWHNVTFLSKEKKGYGLALKFLKTIDEPWEGKFKVNHENWRGKLFTAHVTIETYQGVARNKIAWLKSPEEDGVPF